MKKIQRWLIIIIIVITDGDYVLTEMKILKNRHDRQIQELKKTNVEHEIDSDINGN